MCKKVAKRTRFYLKEKTYSANKAEIKKEIQKTYKRKEGLSDCKINRFLQSVPNFLGCFAQDQLRSLVIHSLPVTLIVNFDNSTSSGSHWVAVRIDKKTIEIFDTLGFNTFHWPKIPYFFLYFLHKYSNRRTVKISQEIQPVGSSLCGFYCVFFVFHRLFHTFSDCTKSFSAKLYKNDLILINLFNKI